MNFDGGNNSNNDKCADLNGFTAEIQSPHHSIKGHASNGVDGDRSTLSSTFTDYDEGYQGILLSPENLLKNKSLATDNIGKYGSSQPSLPGDDSDEEDRRTLSDYGCNGEIGGDNFEVARNEAPCNSQDEQGESKYFQTDSALKLARDYELKDSHKNELPKDIVGIGHSDNKLAVISENETVNHAKPLPMVYEAAKLEVSNISKNGNCTQLSGVHLKGNLLSVPPVNKVLNNNVPAQHFGKVSIEKSSNTSFGTEIKTAGDLTIIQHVDLSKGISPNPELTITDSSESSGWCQKLRYLWATLFLGVLITAAVTGAVIAFLHDIQETQDDGGNAGGDDVPANYTMKLVARSQWSQHPDAKIDNLKYTPASYVVVCHSASNFCNSPTTCTNMIRGIESWGMNTGFTAIAYNFLIAGDGYIYEGRGWTKQGAFSPPMNCKSIGVGFVGNFDHDALLPSMVEAYKILVEEGVRRGALTKDYKMIGYSQVKNSASPGLNIRSVIKTWPHWGPLTSNDTFCTKKS